ncbi:hypothetical protein SLS58_004642 [Diplodia intermedia]|uniref:F-box domain-containing protein n=1 Tax=Diplodia intermedia TaxID=856260 RepID=A0ABR3TTD2_9PEZI
MSTPQRPCLDGVALEIFRVITSHLAIKELRSLRLSRREMAKNTYDTFKSRFSLKACRFRVAELDDLLELSTYPIASTVKHLTLLGFHCSDERLHAIYRRTEIHRIDPRTTTRQAHTARGDNGAHEARYINPLRDILRNLVGLEGIELVDDCSDSWFVWPMQFSPNDLIDDDTVPFATRTTRILLDVLGNNDIRLRYLKLNDMRNTSRDVHTLGVRTPRTQIFLLPYINVAVFQHLRELTLTFTGEGLSPDSYHYLGRIVQQSQKVRKLELSSDESPSESRDQWHYWTGSGMHDNRLMFPNLESLLLKNIRVSGVTMTKLLTQHGPYLDTLRMDGCIIGYGAWLPVLLFIRDRMRLTEFAFANSYQGRYLASFCVLGEVLSSIASTESRFSVVSGAEDADIARAQKRLAVQWILRHVIRGWVPIP